MRFFRYICQKSTLPENPLRQDGLYTKPKSNDLPCSGLIGKPAYAEPAIVAVACVLDFTLLLTKLPSVGTFTQAGLTGLPVYPLHGSKLIFGASLLGAVNTSLMFGARNTSATVPRTSRSWIGRYSTLN